MSSWSLCSKISLLKDLLQQKPLGSGKHYSNIKIPQLYTRERVIALSASILLAIKTCAGRDGDFSKLAAEIVYVQLL